MANDMGEPKPSDAAPTDRSADGAVAAAAPGHPKKFPKGVILGKDGKPCRSCNSFTAWASQSKANLKTAASGTAGTSAAAAVAPNDCPADVEVLGRSSWTLLHSIAATYPAAPSPAEQSDLRSFVRLFSKLYPCWVCAEDFQAYIQKREVRAESRRDFGLWLCDAHNEVNVKLGKPTFDCSKWEERWRTGWKDGRCD